MCKRLDNMPVFADVLVMFAIVGAIVLVLTLAGCGATPSIPPVDFDRATVTVDGAGNGSGDAGDIDIKVEGVVGGEEAAVEVTYLKGRGEVIVCLVFPPMQWCQVVPLVLPAAGAPVPVPVPVLPVEE